MAPRANWKGYLRLSLVSCPIALYPASSFSEKVSFNRINRKTGNRLKQQNVDAETGEVTRLPRTTPTRCLILRFCYSEAVGTGKRRSAGGNILPMMLNLNGQHAHVDP
jgi:Ku70/Ku80 beta-barrel domain